MPVPTMTDFEAACSRIQTLEEQMMLLQTYLVNSGPRLPSASNANSPRVTAIDSPHLKALTSANGHFPLSRLAVSAVRNNDESRDLGHVQARTGERDHEDMAMMLEVSVGWRDKHMHARTQAVEHRLTRSLSGKSWTRSTCLAKCCPASPHKTGLRDGPPSQPRPSSQTDERGQDQQRRWRTFHQQ